MEPEKPKSAAKTLPRQPSKYAHWATSVYSYQCYPLNIEDGKVKFREPKEGEDFLRPLINPNRLPTLVADTGHARRKFRNVLVDLFLRADEMDKYHLEPELDKDGQPKMRYNSRTKQKEPKQKRVYELSKADRNAIYFPFAQRKTTRTSNNAEIYDLAAKYWGEVPSMAAIAKAECKGILDSENTDHVISKFITTVKKYRAGKGGPPRHQHVLEEFCIPLRVRGDKRVDWLHTKHEKSHAYIGYVEKSDRAALRRENPEQYYCNGWFDIIAPQLPKEELGDDLTLEEKEAREEARKQARAKGKEGRRIYLHVATHRPLPMLADPKTREIGRIRYVNLVGKHEAGMQFWDMKIQVTVEHPHFPSLPKTGRVCGVDIGWRVMGEALRVAVIRDNEGNCIEVYLPLSHSNRSRRRMEKYFEGAADASRVNTSEIRTHAEVRDQKKYLSESVEALKSQLADLPASMVEAWPEDAIDIQKRCRTADGKPGKLGARGLRRLGNILLDAMKQANESADANEHLLSCLEEGSRMISDWYHVYRPTLKRTRAAEVRMRRFRDDLYRQVASLLAKWYDQIQINGVDLSRTAGSAKKKRQEREAIRDEIAIKNLDGSPSLKLPKPADDCIEEEGAKYRQFAGVSFLRQFIIEAGRKHGRIAEKEKVSLACPACGAKLDPESPINVECECGATYDQDVLKAETLLSSIEHDASTSLEPIDIPERFRRYLRIGAASR